MADFLPRRDAALRDWTRVFAQGIQHDPAGLGLTLQQAADYAALQQEFAAAYQASQEPMTRGVRTVMVKDRMRKAVVKETRVLARLVRAQPGVTPEVLLKLGLLRAGGEAVGAEGAAADVEQERGPKVRVKADSRRVSVTLRGEGYARRRPSGSVGAAVYWAIADEPPRTLEEYTLAGNTTKLEMAFVLPADVAPPGTQVWVTACWLDAKLQPGQVEPPVSARVGYGSLLKAA